MMRQASTTMALIVLFLWFTQVTLSQDWKFPAQPIGKKTEVYQLRPGLILRVSRNLEGRVQEYLITQGDLTEHPDRTKFILTPDLVKELIDELVPQDQRGTPSVFYGVTCCAGCCTTNYNYERVIIQYNWRTGCQPLLRIEFLDQKIPTQPTTDEQDIQEMNPKKSNQAMHTDSHPPDSSM